MPEYKDMNVGLHDLVRKAKGPETILDAFCFVVGFTAAELEERRATLFDKPKMTAAEKQLFERYSIELARLEASWTTFAEYSNRPFPKSREIGQKSQRKK